VSTTETIETGAWHKHLYKDVEQGQRLFTCQAVLNDEIRMTNGENESARRETGLMAAELPEPAIPHPSFVIRHSL
jgi:hypothetical protein